MKVEDASPLVLGLFDKHPKALFKMTAHKVLSHALLGPADDPVGEGEGVELNAPENGDSADSMEKAQ